MIVAHQYDRYPLAAAGVQKILYMMFVLWNTGAQLYKQHSARNSVFTGEPKQDELPGTPTLASTGKIRTCRYSTSFDRTNHG